MEYFIAKRLRKKKNQDKKISKSILTIAVMSISLAIIVNLLTLFIIKGFQTEVRNKILGFGSHLQILSASENSIYEASPILKEQSFLPQISTIKGVKNIASVGYKPVLFQSEKTQRIIPLSSHTDTTILEQNIHAAILKGVDKQYDWTFFQQHLVQGEIPNFTTEETSTEIVISQKTAIDLQFSVGDTVRAYFVRQNPVLKWLIIRGIYNTGFEEYDKQIALADLRLVQELNDWGIQASIEIDDQIIRTNGFQDLLIVKVNTKGGHGQLRYDWGDGYELYGSKSLHLTNDTTIRVIVSDFKHRLNEEKNVSIADTCTLKITVKGNKNADNLFDTQEGRLLKIYLNEQGTKYVLRSGEKTLEVEELHGKGSANNYVALFEIAIDDWQKLDEIRSQIYSKIAFIPTDTDELLQVVSIRETEQGMFVWLDFLNINLVIIIVLMLLIGLVNMGATLLVLILVRTNFIGILKALGSSNWRIQKLFLLHASYLIFRGMLIGNIIGLGLASLQYFFHIIPLNSDVYYLNTVPIEWNWTNWFFLNVGTLIVCVCVLVIPSSVITKMNPAKSLRF